MRIVLSLLALLIVPCASAESQIVPQEHAVSPAAGKADFSWLSDAAPGGSVLAWIQFADKGLGDGSAMGKSIERQRSLTSERTLARRLKVRPSGGEVLYGDLPLSEIYVMQVESRGLRIRTRSRWFNAVSVEGKREDILNLTSLPYVYQVAPVARLRGERLDDESATIKEPNKPAALDYGTSLNQNEQIHVTDLHKLGLTGKDVIIGVLDTGIDALSTSTLDHLDIIAQRDFVDGDSTPIEQGEHGTSVLSAIAGYDPGRLIGPAYEASFLIGRTEIDDREVVLETDHWIAGIEWMEQEGADIVSSSLSYLDFDDGTLLVPDGVSSAITLAASAAVERGVFVVVSAGNSGANGIGTPADGYSVCAVGAVDSSSNIASFSSRGPTIDGRTKPDICAKGVNTTVATDGLLSRLLISTTSAPLGEAVPLSGSFLANSGSEGLWMTLLLEDKGAGEAAIGIAGSGLPAGLRLVHRRGAASTVLLDGPLTEELLTSPSPQGFGYDGQVVVAANGAFLTTSGNDLDVALRMEISDRIPGGLQAGDILEATTTARHSSTVGLKIGIMTDAERAGIRLANGTSFSCPLIAGAAALLLQANPGWGPKEILAAFRQTASQADSPDNIKGWGIANAYAAALGGVLPPSADLDGNGTVDALDLLTFTGDWDQSRALQKPLEGDVLRSDLNRDTRLDDRDLYLLSDQWAD